ncbi:8361_t:CDS:2, partial [Racocetra persica]
DADCKNFSLLLNMTTTPQKPIAGQPLVFDFNKTIEKDISNETKIYIEIYHESDGWYNYIQQIPEHFSGTFSLMPYLGYPSENQIQINPSCSNPNNPDSRDSTLTMQEYPPTHSS